LEGPAEAEGRRPPAIGSTRTRKLSRKRERPRRTSDRRPRLTQRDIDEWLSSLALDLAQARELARRSDNEQFRIAVETLDCATLSVLQKLGTLHGMPDVSDIVARAIAESHRDSSSLRLLGRDLRDF